MVLHDETRLAEFGLDGASRDHEAVLVAASFALRLQLLAFPGLQISIHPQGKHHAIPGYPMELTQHGQAVFRLADVVHQAHGEDAVDRVVRQIDGEGRGLQGTHPLHHLCRLVIAGDGEHVGGIVRPDDHAVFHLGQHRPEAPGATRQVQHQVRLAGELQCLAGDLDIACVGKFPPEAGLMLVQVLFGVASVVLVGELEVYGFARHRREVLFKFRTEPTYTLVIRMSDKCEESVKLRATGPRTGSHAAPPHAAKLPSLPTCRPA
ncbi:hypothetical protein D3C81_705160 [compost metagenome]